MNSKLTGEGGAVQKFCQKKSIDVKKKPLTFSTLTQRLLSIDMKTKVIHHVSRIKLDNFTGSQHVSDFQMMII